MNDGLVEKFNNQTFTQGLAVLKIKYHNLKILIVQHVPIQEKVKKIDVSRMRNGFIVVTLTSVDLPDIFKSGVKVNEEYENVIYCENFKVSAFKNVIDNLFEFRQNFKDKILMLSNY